MNKELSFKDALQHLEALVNKVEREQTDLDKLAEDLQSARELLAYCEQKLRNIESTIA